MSIFLLFLQLIALVYGVADENTTTTTPIPSSEPIPSPNGPSPNSSEPIPSPNPEPMPLPPPPHGPQCNSSNEDIICGGSICRPYENDTFYCMCFSDIECPQFFICFNNSQCVKKTLWPPTGWDIGTGFVVLLSTILGAASGRGAEGLFISLFMFLLQFPIRKCIALSTVTLFGASVAYTGFYTIKRHPVANRPLIDYNLVCFITPLMLSGSIFGSIIMKVTPIWIFILILILLLIYTTYNITVNGLMSFQQESRKQHFKKREDKPETYGLMSHVDDYGDEDGDKGNPGSIYYSNTIRTILKAEESIPYIYILSIVILWIYVIISVILKGGDILPSPISLQCEQVPYWLYICSILLVSITYTIIIGFLLKSHHEYKISIEYPQLPSDISWTLGGVIILPFISLVAGLASGLFGISPSIVVEPLLQSNLHPDVVRAVSTNVGFFVISTTMILYVLFGWIEYDYGLLFGFIGFIGSVIHLVVVHFLYIKLTNRTSLIQILLGILVGVGTIMLLIGIGMDIKQKSDEGKLFEHSSLCTIF